MTNFQDLRNRFVLTSISSSVIGLLLWFTPNTFTKFLSPVIGFGGMGGVIVSQLITDETEKNWIKMNKLVKEDSVKLQAENRQNKLQSEANLIKFEAELKQSKIETKSLIVINEDYQRQLAESRQISDKQAKVSNLLLILTAANFADLAESESDFNERLSKVLEVDADSSADLLQDSLNIFVNEINGLMSATKYHYPDLEDKVNGIAAKVADKIEEFTKLIKVVRTFTTCNELIGAVTSIQHQIIYHLLVVKGHLYQAQLREIKLGTLPIVEHNEIVDSVNSLWTQKYAVIAGNLQSIRQEFSTTANQVIEAYNTDFTEMVGVGMSDAEKMEALQLELLRLQKEIIELEKPLLFSSGSPKSDNGNRIIAHYLKRKIKLDAFDWVETDMGYTLYFYVGRNGNNFIGEEILNDENSGEKIRDLVSSLNIPEFKRSERGTHYALEIQTSRKKVSTKDLKIKDILSVGGNRSWLITGHPGAGKTSIMIYLGQQIGGSTAQRIALNPHADETSNYEKFGFVEINDLADILFQIELLYEELKLRRIDTRRRFPLVICIDELSAVLDASEKPKDVMDICKQISVEGRKFGMTLIIGSHSQTVRAIESDGEFRGAFHQLFLVGAARYAVNQTNRQTNLNKEQLTHVQDTAYPALLLTNGQYSLVKHPTHGDYEEYRDIGNYPENLEYWDVNLLTVKVVESVKSEFVWVHPTSSTQPEPNPTQPEPNPNPTQLKFNPDTSYSRSSQVETIFGKSENMPKKGGFSENEPNPNPKTGEPFVYKGFEFPTMLEHDRTWFETFEKTINDNALTVSQKILQLWGIKASKSIKYVDLKMKIESITKS